MRKIITSAILALMLVSCFSMFIPVKATTINSPVAPASYQDYDLTFKGTYGLASDFSGMFLDIKVKGTASNNNNETVTLQVYVAKTGSTKKYTFLTDGQEHTFKNIYLGLSGGSSVYFELTGANPDITLYINMIADS